MSRTSAQGIALSLNSILFMVALALTSGCSVRFNRPFQGVDESARAKDSISSPNPSNTSSSCVGVAATTGSVQALYPTQGRDWNSYVEDNGASIYQASGATCSGTQCLHGGEMRSVTISTATSCTGLTATDLLGAFDWTCDSSSGSVRMVSIFRI